MHPWEGSASNNRPALTSSGKRETSSSSPEGRGILKVKENCLWLWVVKRLPRHHGFPLISWALQGNALHAHGNNPSKSLPSAAPSSSGRLRTGNTRTRRWVRVDRSCPLIFFVGIIYMFFLCRRLLVSQDLMPLPALVENNYRYGICFVKFKATHKNEAKFNVSHPLHTDQSSRSHFCISIILLNLHLRPFCNVTFGLTPGIIILL